MCIVCFASFHARKTAKSRKKAVSGSGDCGANNASSVASKSKPERVPLSPQPEPLARMKRVND